MDKKSTSKSLCKRSVASTKAKSCESLHYQYRKINQIRRTLGSGNGKVFYFDSYGLPPLDTEIINFLNNHSLSWRYNQQRLQSLQSKVCGLYCIFTLDAAARGYNIQKYLQKTFLSTDHHRNDRDVSLWFNQQYGNLYNKTFSIGQFQ